MRFIPLCILFSALLLASSCVKNEQDKNDPSLSLAASNEGQSVRSGEFVEFQVICADDLNLESVRVEVFCPQSAADTHWGPDTDPENAMQLYEVMGETLELSSAFLLIEDLYTDECTLTLTCIDAEGNESNQDSFTFNLRNGADGVGPSIALNDEVENLEGLVITTSTFIVDGIASDPSSVDYASIEILPEQAFPFFKEKDFSDEDLTEVDFTDLEMTSPNPGVYSLRIIAIDSLQNLNERTFPLTVE